ncbi:MAG: 23S rRNA (uracil(1939)-C(5))-methyltransferase RlmD [Candidatus Protistobacter heckmanni]|nr:23S rRNA (uracil(1939)-C(5))-methyltransferase RlmD [Candidatus Protistobacter heckmanni]
MLLNDTRDDRHAPLRILSLDAEAQGVGRLPMDDDSGKPGKVVFVEGALPGELVRFKIWNNKRSYAKANLTEVLQASSQRVEPRCQYYRTCGGCAMQHFDTRGQLAIKQRVIEDNLWHLAKLKPECVLRPIAGPDWGYRYRARLTVRDVPSAGGVLIGFHARKRSYVVDMLSCEVLPPHVSALLPALRTLVAGLSMHDRLPQIELAMGEHGGGTATALVLRILKPLLSADHALLKRFATEHEVQIWVQPEGPESVAQLYPLPGEGQELAYGLPEFGIVMPFMPTDFTQVNHRVNRVLVSTALRLLGTQLGEKVLDLFCGIGNFTLPLATQAASVVGIEGSPVLTRRAQANAVRNGLGAKTRFESRNLFEVDAEAIARLGGFDRWLIDPPREGALAVSKALAQLHAGGQEAFLPRRIVYVSCNPDMLARDAGLLVHEGGYKLEEVGVVNMFPHTAHVESVAVFQR